MVHQPPGQIRNRCESKPRERNEHFNCKSVLCKEFCRRNLLWLEARKYYGCENAKYIEQGKELICFLSLFLFICSAAIGAKSLNVSSANIKWKLCPALSLFCTYYFNFHCGLLKRDVLKVLRHIKHLNKTEFRDIPRHPQVACVACSNCSSVYSLLECLRYRRSSNLQFKATDII